MSSLWDVAAPLIVACLLGALGWGLRYARQARQRERDRDAKLDRLVLVFLEGAPADPFLGTAAVPSVVQQLSEITDLRTAVTRLDRTVGELRESNVDAGAASKRLSDDVTTLRGQVGELRTQLDEVRSIVAAPHPPYPA